MNGGLEGALFLRSFILNFLGCLVLDSLFGLVHLLSMLKQLRALIVWVLFTLVIRGNETSVGGELAAVIRDRWFESALLHLLGFLRVEKGLHDSRPS